MSNNGDIYVVNPLTLIKQQKREGKKEMPLTPPPPPTGLLYKPLPVSASALSGLFLSQQRPFLSYSCLSNCPFCPLPLSATALSVLFLSQQLPFLASTCFRNQFCESGMIYSGSGSGSGYDFLEFRTYVPMLFKDIFTLEKKYSQTFLKVQELSYSPDSTGLKL